MDKLPKIVFLDIDGVLNSYKFMRDTDPKVWNRGGPYMMQPDLVERLGRFLELSGARVVLSSAWRHYYTDEQIESFLSYHDLDIEILDRTPVLDQWPKVMGIYVDPGESRTGTRGEEIQKWLSENPVDSFVIFDDNDHGISDLFADRFCQTDEMVGLSDSDCERAIEILSTYRREAA